MAATRASPVWRLVLLPRGIQTLPLIAASARLRGIRGGRGRLSLGLFLAVPVTGPLELPLLRGGLELVMGGAHADLDCQRG